MRVISLTIDETLPTLNQLLRLHHRRRKAIMLRIAWKLKIAMVERGGIGGAPMKRCKIVIRRYCNQRVDVDAKGSLGKLVLDALQPCSKRHPVGLGLIENDSSDCIVCYEIEEVNGRNRTDVYIEEV